MTEAEADEDDGMWLRWKFCGGAEQVRKDVIENYFDLNHLYWREVLFTGV